MKLTKFIFKKYTNVATLVIDDTIYILSLDEANKLLLDMKLELHVRGDICHDRCCDEYGY